jgi:hypothetical protein
VVLGLNLVGERDQMDILRTSHSLGLTAEILLVISGFICLCVMIYFSGRGRPQICRCGQRVFGFPKYCPKCGCEMGS